MPHEMVGKTARRMGLASVAALALAAVAVIATARPGDRTLWPPQPGAATVRIWVVSHGWHAGVAIPRASAAAAAGRYGLPALAQLAARFEPYDWLELGWGEERFYRSTPTLASLDLGLALRALFSPGNRSVLHVVGLHASPEAVFRGSDVIAIELSEAGFTRLLAQLDATFARGENGAVSDLGGGLYGASRFFRADGSFHLFRVCNHWVADLLAAGGLPTAPIPSLLPQGLMLDLRWRAGLLPAGPAGATSSRR
jgi:uncharacterized protein (TIGR02117 family)